MLAMVDRFVEFLLRELQVRDWTQADLARKAGLSRMAVSAVIAGKRDPGPDLCNAIAGALELPPETVFREAGLLRDLPTPRAKFEEIVIYRLSLLDDDQLENVLRYIKFISTDEQKPIKIKT